MQHADQDSVMLSRNADGSAHGHKDEKEQKLYE